MVQKTPNRTIPVKWKKLRFCVRLAYFGFWIAFALLMGGIVVNLVAPSSNYPIISLNSHNKPPPYVWTLKVPNEPLSISNMGNYTIIINATISASQPFADGVNITVSADGCIKNEFGPFLTGVIVGFNNSYDARNPNSGQTFNGDSLLFASDVAPPSPACPAILAVQQTDQSNGLGVRSIENRTKSVILFKNPGEYPAIVQITYANFTVHAISYPNDVIDVQSSSALNSQIQAYAGIGFFLVAGAGGVMYREHDRFRRFYQAEDAPSDSPSSKNAKRTTSKETPAKSA